MRLTLPLFVSIILPLTVLSGSELRSISFADPITISPSGTDGAASSEAGDFDQDGDFEFISAATRSTSDAHFRLYQFNGTGFDVITLLPDSEVQSRQDRFGGDLTVADINGDDWPDIVVPTSNNGSGAGELSWFENPDGDLDGTWTEHVVSTWSGSGTGNVVAHMSEVDVGDINGDGLPDIVTRDISHGVYLLLQNATGWEPRIFIPTLSREGLDLFNPDGDNDLDIILNGIWLETPADPANDDFIEHTYASAWYPEGASTNEIRDYAVQLAVRDFNGDQRDDIAISNSEELNNASSTDSKPKGIRLYLAPENPKTESWTEVILEDEHFSWHSLEPADLDCDGDLDLISAISTVGKDNAGKEIAYFLNDGTGENWTKVIFSNDVFVYNSTLADADGDGDADFFAPDSFNTGPMRYFENTGLPIAPDTEAPSMPENLIAGVISTERIDLTWSASTDNVAVSNYRIFQDGSEIGSSSAPSFSVTGLSPSTNFSFSVRARDLAGNDSAPSETIIASTLDPTAASTLDQLLIAYWNFDENVGLTTSDLVAARIGMLSDTAWTAGRFGSGLDLDLETDRVEAAPFLIGSDQLTLSCWVRPRSFSGNANEARFISKATSTSAEDHDWMLGNFVDGSALRFRLRLRDASGTSTTHTLVSSTGQLTLDEWTHVAATYDGTAMRLYQNGEEVASLAQSGTIEDSASTAIGLGNQPTGAGDRALNGLLDEVRIYRQALSASDLEAIKDLSLYDQWRYSFLNEPDDEDNVPLFLEYAFDLDPTRFSPNPLRIVDGQPVYTTPRSELSYELEYSADLTNWGTMQPTGDTWFARVKVSADAP